MNSTASFIRAAEIWVSVPDQWLLEFGTGAFGPAMAFATLSRSMCFGRGEGLPGQAWEEGRPIVLPQFENTRFRRAAAAAASGLSSAVALPFFAADKLQSVLVIYCGNGPEQAGALELWRADSAANSKMTLVDGAYGPAAAAFESASREISFARGAGLPGLAWEQGTTQFLEELGASGAFVRGAFAAQADLIRGLAIPVGSLTDSYVVTFLASARLPLAHRVELWAADSAASQLHRTYAFSEMHGGHSALEAFLPLSHSEDSAAGSIARAWLTGAPVINELPASEPGPPAAAATSIGAKALLAIPLKRDGAVVQVLALYI